MANIENGLRYQAVKDELSAQDGVVVVDEIIEQSHNGRKLNMYEEVTIIVAPESTQDIRAFTAGLVTNVEPMNRHDAENGKLRTFDTLGDGRFRTTTIQAIPSVKSAQEIER